MREPNLIPIGMLVIFIGMLIIIIGAILGAKGRGETKVAFGGFIGPIPFGFGTDKQMVYLVIALSAVVAIIFFVVNYLQK